MDNPIGRLTWQMSQKNKLAVYYDRALRLRAAAMSNNTDPATASVVWNTPIFSTGSAKWTSTLSSQILLEVGGSYNMERYDNLYQDGILAERNTPAWYQNVRKDDLSTGFLWNASSAQLGNYPDRYTLSAAMSYVTGAHNVKFGVLNGWGQYRRYNNANGDLYQTYTGGVPHPGHGAEHAAGGPGEHGPPARPPTSRTRGGGATSPSTTASATTAWRRASSGRTRRVGRFTDMPAYDDFEVPTWSDFSPRTSVVWDIFGNGKTAVRTGFNRFMTAQTTGFARLYAPTALTTQNLPWTDVNGDDIAQGERGCTYLTAGCEINFANLRDDLRHPRACPRPTRTSSGPASTRSTSALTQELWNRLTVTGEWYHNRFTDITERNNVARNFDSYTPVDVVSPIDGSVITMYNVKPEFRAAVENVDASDPDIKRHYNGFELGFNARLGRGARIFGGFNLERTLADTCSAGTDPNYHENTATSGTAASRGRSSSSSPAPTRCRGGASPPASRCRA